ncbi:MAG: ATP-binding cassette domain-containing protein [Vicinamibacterales bacterium]
MERRVTELLELVGLDARDHAARRPDQLSGGQRQRVGVARALAADPPILLMDEPFGALDPVTRAEIHHEFRRIQERVRKTVVLVTHDMAEAFALATHVGVLSDGVLAVIDEPAVVARSTDARVRPLLDPLIEATALLGHEATRMNVGHEATRSSVGDGQTRINPDPDHTRQ